LNILVTGGLGFIGSNFILKTLSKFQEYTITNIDACLPGSNFRNLENIQDDYRYNFIKGNITDPKLMDKLISEHDIIINFAAESHVDRSISNPRPFFDTNIFGVCTILESVKKFNKKLIQISTDEVFGSLEQGSANEQSLLNPSSPYSSSKASAELIGNSYHITYNLDIIITRCTNNFGPRQFPEKLIPKVILLAEQNKKIPIYGSGANIRDWIFVDDHCEAIHNVLLNGKSGKSYNISAENEIDNITIVKKILSLMNKSEDLIEFVEDRPGHDFRYSLDSSKLRTELQWVQKTNFEEGLKKTVNWYMSNQQWCKDLDRNYEGNIPWKNKSQIINNKK